MKTSFKIHIFFYIVSFILLFCGYFKIYLSILYIIGIHELGHIIAGSYYNWDIEKIVILPFGAITHFKTKLNVNMKEEFMVTIMGPFFQIIGSTIYYLFSKDTTFMFYHYFLLFINLIPIIPLDGSKLLHLFLCKIVSYKKALKYSLIVSFILIIILIIYELYNFNFLIFTWLILLLFENKREKDMLGLKFYIFLKERLENNYKLPYCYYNKLDVSNIKRGYKSIFKIDEKMITEKDCIKQYFLKKNKALYLTIS